MPNVPELVKQRFGSRRRVFRVRPIKGKLNERRELQSIINEMVATVFRYADEFAAAVSIPIPVLVDSEGETIGIFKDAVDDLDRLIRLVVLQTQQVMVRLEARVRGWARGVEGRHRREFVEGVLTATTIDVSTLLDPTAGTTVAEYVTWATSLIRDVGDEARRRMANAVIDAVQRRVPPRELARTIKGIHEMSSRRARNIAADQTNKLNNALDRARQEEAGIDRFTWRHSGKKHFRPHHKRRNGRVYEWRSNSIRRGDFPGEPPFCGCVAQATIVNE